MAIFYPTKSQKKLAFLPNECRTIVTNSDVTCCDTRTHLTNMVSVISYFGFLIIHLFTMIELLHIDRISIDHVWRFQ